MNQAGFIQGSVEVGSWGLDRVGGLAGSSTALLPVAGEMVW